MRAICDVGGSTKTVNGPTKGYIGEKGVGFKSVFKVADRVWISSGHFEFKFEKAHTLGMLVPIPASFPAQSPVHEPTMFAFRIPGLKDRESIKKSLSLLNAEFLLFLNKLVKIEVKLFPHPHSGRLPSYSRSYTCEDRDTDGVAELIERSPPLFQTRERVYTTRFNVDDMPREKKRIGIQETVINLSFPLSSKSSAIRRVYNFLPVRSYGLAVSLVRSSAQSC